MSNDERIESSTVCSVISRGGGNINWGVTLAYVVVGRYLDKYDTNWLVLTKCK